MKEKLSITKKQKQLQEQINNLKKIEKEINEGNSYVIGTNTAFLLNSKIDEIFERFGYLSDWIRIKHEQHWEGKNDSSVEITFKVKQKIEGKK